MQFAKYFNVKIKVIKIKILINYQSAQRTTSNRVLQSVRSSSMSHLSNLRDKNYIHFKHKNDILNTSLTSLKALEKTKM